MALLCLALAACQPALPAGYISQPPTAGAEVTLPVLEIELDGPAAGRDAEFSGMAWYGDTLVLLPQYPQRFGENGHGAVFTLSKAEILDYIDGKRSEPLHPGVVPLINADLGGQILVFQGFEAIAFSGQRAYLTIESWKGFTMAGYLVAGDVGQDLDEIRLDPAKLERIDSQNGMFNMSEEALLAMGDELVTLFEANGAEVNPAPQAHRFSQDLQPLGELPFPNLDYRITDATAPDGEDRFWVTNYLHPEDMPLVPEWQRQLDRRTVDRVRISPVERLVEFQRTADAIVRTDAPLLNLELEGERVARNWEGIVRLDGRGFLLVTDKVPRTILGFVAWDGAAK
ncbi:MAG: hypothetical protein GYA17_00430 [Chloroflexi bacterium]|nr:hypothetical protein [Chloroflexota bacterium]